MLNKTKATLQSRLSHTTYNIQDTNILMIQDQGVSYWPSYLEYSFFCHCPKFSGQYISTGLIKFLSQYALGKFFLNVQLLVFLCCFNLRPQASSTQAEKLADESSFFSSFTDSSISSSNSWGNLIFFNWDLLFLFPVAIEIATSYELCCVYTHYLKSDEIKSLDVYTHYTLRCVYTNDVALCGNSNSSKVMQNIEGINQNINEVLS